MTFEALGMQIFVFDKQPLPDLPTVSCLTVEDVVAQITADRHRADAVPTAVISAGNSIGFMDGGSDLGYVNSIPDIQTAVQKGIAHSRYVSRNGRPYIPVGDAMGFLMAMGAPPASVPVRFVCAPTMYLPHDVSTTRNPYHAFKTALQLCQYMRAERVYVPMMCTGYGKFDYEASFALMAQAAEDAIQRPRPSIFVHESYVYTNAPNVGAVLREQPKIYDLVEFGGKCD